MQLERTQDESNFGNADWPGGKPPEWPWPREDPQVLLRRLELPRRRFGTARTVEEFELRRPITYLDETGKSPDGRLITVPDPAYPFTTDLTSVPRLFTWLVPKSGRHLPAALIHDGLVGGDPASYLTDDKSTVDRIDADAIFRNAMHDVGVGLVRRWLVWSAVSNASLVSGARAAWTTQKWWFRVAGPLALLFILWCGLSATLEVLDVGTLPRGLGSVMSLDLPLTGGNLAMGDLPWIDERAWYVELVQGLAGAIVVPLALAVLWGRYYRSGAIAGLALATLFHATVVLAAVAVFYQAAELVAKVSWVALLAAVVLVTGALVVFLDAVGWL